MFIWTLTIYLAAVNIAAYFLMRADKQRAQNKEWRIEESVFFTLCFSGGFIGIHLAMEHFRHKTKHWQFRAAVIISAVIFLIILPIIFFMRLKTS
ncbi:DUF1294 domain-containing protein [Mannheimia massilioguelmaensis]|uniref:DUF1294 domain-containing protein n=1 Tax=Mannheimia massilioguelmaensis TaxID=1604354 RepID=UPI0005C8009F|nr:DUF1294 domain-containing protein [Mannheimia massilioguelmaensis]